MTLKVIQDFLEDLDWDDYLLDHTETADAGGSELRICCPSCGETSFKCYVNTYKKVFNCFKCDFRTGNYDFIDLMSLLEGLPRGAVITRSLINYTPVTPSIDDLRSLSSSLFDEEEAIPPSDTPRAIERLPLGCVPVSSKHTEFLRYLGKRGITAQEIMDMRLHCVPMKWLPVKDSEGNVKGNLGNRFVVPIFHDGFMAGWLARTIYDATPKYLNSPDSDLSKTLWPFVRPKGHRVVIVEGVLDALSVRRAGFNAYATFGKKISGAQVRLLKAWGVSSVTLWFDKKDATKQMKEAADRLKMSFNEVLVPSLREWTADVDAGDLLSDPSGIGTIEKTLTECINVYDQLEFARWTTTF